MADFTFTKKITLLLLLLFLCLDLYSQKKDKINSFSEDFSVFCLELEEFCNSSSEMKLLYKNYNKQISLYNSSQQQLLITVANNMLDKKLRKKPHFITFINSAILINEHNQEYISDWMSVVNEIIQKRSTKKLMDFFEFTITLIKENKLYSSKSSTWIINENVYYFSIQNNEPVVIFSKDLQLSCMNSKGSVKIEDTKGVYYPLLNTWIGGGGIINWENHGFNKDSVFAQMSNYKINTKKSQWTADSSIFFNKKLFNKPLIGQLEHKIANGKESQKYPSFTSYSKDISLKGIFKNVDYKGGYKLIGKEFVADGGDFAKARIIFKREGKDIFVVNSNQFNITDNRIFSSSAGVKIFLDSDSLYHANLSFKYFDDKRQIQLYRDNNGPSGSPMLNTYHNLTIEFELLEWLIDTDVITFGSLPQTDKSIVRFESIDMFSDLRHQSIQGIDAVHPLMLIKRFVDEIGSNRFYVSDFGKYARFPSHQIVPYLIRLARYGFIFYDFSDESITVQPMLYNYIRAASKIDDYDVISFNSLAFSDNEGALINDHLVNSILNISSKELIISGVYNVKLSDVRNVEVSPDRGVITVKKNRDLLFDGRIRVGGGRLYVSGKDFYFDYDQFKVNLHDIDFLQFAVPEKGEKEKLRPIETALEYIKNKDLALQGELYLDYPSNKSGYKKDSFPEFPIFKSFERSYAYYDKESIFNGVYNRSDFYFHVDTFVVDSLDTYTTRGLRFPGVFKSSGIFPDFRDTLVIQDDYSLGFSRNTPKDGYSIYNEKGTFYNNISLSNEGLIGHGIFEYRNAKASSDEILWFPDSANMHTTTFEISEISSGIEFPEVYNTETYVHFLPFEDKLYSAMKNNLYDFYAGEASFSGNLLMQPSSLTGNGVMKLKKAEVEADLFSYNANWFGSDNADLRVYGGDNYAIKAYDLRTHIDLKMSEGIFNSNVSDSSNFDFIINQYKCYFDICNWDMNEDVFFLGDNSDINSLGSNFISTHPNQFGLNFFAKTGQYDLNEHVIKTYGTESIVVADATIRPDSGFVTILKNAEIKEFHNATIELTHHVFTNAHVDIESKFNYNATGDYTFLDAFNNKQHVFFNTIYVNPDRLTQARGDLNDKKPFQIDSKFNFKGSVDLYSDEKHLTFDGYFSLNHNCELLAKEWVNFRSKINPKDIVISLDSQLVNEKNENLYTGIMMRKDTISIYSTFLNKKKNIYDTELMSAFSSISYDKNRQAYVICGSDSLDNSFVLYDNFCQTAGEGEINLNMELGKINLQTFGEINHNLREDNIIIEGFVLLDFHFSERAMLVMANEILSDKDIYSIEYYNALFNRNVQRVIKDPKEALKFQKELSKNKIRSVPKELRNHELIFSNVKLKWDNQNKAFVSEDRYIGLNSINNKFINKDIEGRLIFGKQMGSNKDFCFIHLISENAFCFNYERTVMATFSYNQDFHDIIKSVSDVKRRLDGRPRYIYKFVGTIAKDMEDDDWYKEQLRDIDKKYGF